MKQIVTFIFFIFSFCHLFAQIAEPGNPIKIEGMKSASLVPVFAMPKFEHQKAIDYDKANSIDKSFVFAFPYAVNIDVKKDGALIKVADHTIWRLKVTSAGAYSVNLIFNRFKLPSGARLFVMSPDQEQILGAFTARNNKPGGALAIFPVSGDEILIQYEEPDDASFVGELCIGQVAHDFKGVFANPQRRRPKDMLAQWCNVNVNCADGNDMEIQKRAVCRMLAHGTELCTGTLVNNTAQDKAPYLVTAKHCIENNTEALTSIFDFNYESPICSNIDGDDIQTLSGSSLIAAFDSLDMVMVRLTEMPPESYRPYLAGWSVEEEPEIPIFALHHPMGDTKKISREDHNLLHDTYRSGGRVFLENGHWRVPHWEMGTTEVGSSGSGIFTRDGLFLGTLSGGAASCANNVNDYYGRLNKKWDYRNDPNEQFKHWLDPMNTGALKLDGMDPYEDTDFSCSAIINFSKEDTVTWYSNVSGVSESIGYLSGNNSIGITEVAEFFGQTDSCELAGISIGIARNYFRANSDIIINIYEDQDSPERATFSGKYPIAQLEDESLGVQGVMNYLSFGKPLKLKGNFFIGIELPEAPDTLALLQAEWRITKKRNTFWVNRNNEWITANKLVNGNFSSSLLIQAIVCNAYFSESDTSEVKEFDGVKLYPNPTNGYLFVDAFENAGKGTFTVTDMAGKICFSDEINSFNESQTQFFDLRFLIPGFYIAIIEMDNEKYTTKFIKTH